MAQHLNLMAMFFDCIILSISKPFLLKRFDTAELRDRAFIHGAMGHQIDPSWGGPIELFLIPASAPRLV